MVERRLEGTDGTMSLSDELTLNNRFWSAQYHRDTPDVGQVQGYIVSWVDDNTAHRIETMLARQAVPATMKVQLPLHGARRTPIVVRCVDLRRLDHHTVLCRFEGELRNAKREWEIVAA